jgi:site-specific recombinase
MKLPFSTDARLQQRVLSLPRGRQLDLCMWHERYASLDRNLCIGMHLGMKKRMESLLTYDTMVQVAQPDNPDRRAYLSRLP